jgi:hypothetical protein
MRLSARARARVAPPRPALSPGSGYSYCMISPIRGDFTGFRVQVSDTLIPHNRAIFGMRNRHPGPASGRGGCYA